MRAPLDRKTVIRIAGCAISLTGLGFSVAAFVRFVRSVAGNAVEGSPALTHYPEYYRRLGDYYGRGFTTGFFACYFLMLFAIIVGSWVDRIRRARRAATQRPAAPALAAVPAPQE